MEDKNEIQLTFPYWKYVFLVCVAIGAFVILSMLINENRGRIGKLEARVSALEARMEWAIALSAHEGEARNGKISEYQKNIIEIYDNLSNEIKQRLEAGDDTEVGEFPWYQCNGGYLTGGGHDD